MGVGDADLEGVLLAYRSSRSINSLTYEIGGAGSPSFLTSA